MNLKGDILFQFIYFNVYFCQLETKSRQVDFYTSCTAVPPIGGVIIGTNRYKLIIKNKKCKLSN